MSTKNEMIFINRILNAELSIRKTAKQFGLRRDDLIRRMREALANDKANLEQLELIIVINKMLFDNIKINEAAKELNLTIQELDKRILKTLSSNEDKMQRYLDYKNGVPKNKKSETKNSNIKKNNKNAKNMKDNNGKSKNTKDNKKMKSNGNNKRSK